MAATQTEVRPAALRAQRSRLSPAARESLQVCVPLVAIIIVLSVVANASNSAFLTTGNIQQILLSSAVLGVLSVGQTLLLVGGQLDLSVGSLVSLGSVMAAKMVTAGQPGWWASVVVVVAGLATGLLWGLIVSYLKVPPFILTLGGLAALSSIALTMANSTPVPVPDAFQWLQSGSFLGLRAPVVVWLICCVVAYVLLHMTRFGRNVFSLGANEEAAYLAGVPTTRVKIAIFLLNGAFTGIGALVMTGTLGAGDPSDGVGMELVVIAAIVLGGASLAGGRGSIIGSTLGVLVLGVVTSALTFLSVPQSYNQLVFGGILITATCVTALAELRRRRVRRA